jgi:hypothetical protein
MPDDPKAGPAWPDFMAGPRQGAVRQNLGPRQAFELPRDMPNQLLTVLEQLDHAAPENENKREKEVRS